MSMKKIERILDLTLFVEFCLIVCISLVIFGISTGVFIHWLMLSNTDPALADSEIIAFGVPIGIFLGKLGLWLFPNPFNLFGQKNNQENSQ